MKNLFLFILLFISSEVFGQLKTGANIFTLDIGFTMLKGTSSNSSISGYNFNLVYDRASTAKVSGGASVGYIRAQDESGERAVSYSTIPILMQGKFFPLEKSKSFYLQGGVGIHFSNLEYLGPNGYAESEDNGIMFLAGLGSLISFDGNFFFVISYNFNWLDSQTYQNGIIHNLKIGFAFN